MKAVPDRRLFSAARSVRAAPDFRPAGAAAWRLLALAAALFSAAGPFDLEARILRVPAEHATIKSAVAAARDGDTILVGDGVYIEENIVVDRKLRITATRPYGAVIYGPEEKGVPVFSVTADAEIDGFVLKNGACGIMVRGMSGVRLAAHDLVILNMVGAGILVNAMAGNLGEAVVTDVIVDRCRTGLETNDARGIDAKRCLISNCRYAFTGYDHIYFRVDQVQVWNCPVRLYEHSPPAIPPATNRIEFGSGMALSPGANNAGPGEGRRLNILGDICLSIKEYDRAGACFLNAVRLARPKGPDRAELLWEAQYGLGRVAEARGDLSGALSRYRLAVDALQGLVRSLPPRADKADFFLDKLGVFEDLIGLLVRMHSGDPGHGYAREAFACAEKAKAGGFLEFLRVSGVDPDRGLEPGLRLRERSVRDAITEAQLGLQEEGLGPGAAGALRERLAAAETEYLDVVTRIHLSNPVPGALVNANPGDVDRLRAGLLDERTALIEYVVGNKASYAFCVSRKGITPAVLPGAAELVPTVEKYLKLVRMDEGGVFAGFRGGRRLYDILLAPFAAELEDVRRIIVVPDGELFLLPFEALVRGGERPGSDRFLVEDFEFSYAPSAACLLDLSVRRPVRPYGVDLLAVACSGPSRPTPDAPPLVHATREVGDIAGFFPAGRRKVLSGSGATEDAIKKIALRGTRFIHFAAHGVLDPERWWRSALLLRADAAGREDGFLQPSDISTLDIDAEMVTLSACRTAEGQLVRGVGVLGLSAAFLAAGARSVVSSLWEVPDGSTARFMKDLYAGLARGESGAAALRRAKIAALRSRYGHPRRWAGFVLIGADGVFAAPAGATTKDLWPEPIGRDSSSLASTSQ
jgi:tetratricopeptide (TPR) repeat protein